MQYASEYEFYSISNLSNCNQVKQNENDHGWNTNGFKHFKFKTRIPALTYKSTQALAQLTADRASYVLPGLAWCGCLDWVHGAQTWQDATSVPLCAGAVWPWGFSSLSLCVCFGCEEKDKSLHRSSWLELFPLDLKQYLSITCQKHFIRWLKKRN